MSNRAKGFRAWLNQQWLEHRSEVLHTTGEPANYDLGKYFNTYKWWLKKIYKESKRGH
jgi:hypothetical protein